MAVATGPVTRRILPPEEWFRVADREPFKTGGLPDPEHWRMVVVERGETIVGFCCLFDTVHWDCWYVDPDERGNPIVFGQLIAGGLGVMDEHGIDLVHTTVPDGRYDVEAMLEHFGFETAPGKLYFYQRKKRT